MNHVRSRRLASRDMHDEPHFSPSCFIACINQPFRTLYIMSSSMDVDPTPAGEAENTVEFHAVSAEERSADNLRAPARRSLTFPR